MKFFTQPAPPASAVPNTPLAGQHGNAANAAPLFAGFFGAVLLLLLAEVPLLSQYRTALTVAGAAIFLLLLVFFARADDLKELFRGQPAVFAAPCIVFALALLVWSGVAVVIAPFRALASAEMLRVLSGVGAFLVAACCFRPPLRPLYALFGIGGIAVLFALIDFSSIGASGGVTGLHTGFFGTHEEMGTLMLLPLAASLGVAVSPRIEEKWRVAAFALSLLLGIALLISQCRSAWLGAAVFAALLAFLRGVAVRADRDRPATSAERTANVRADYRFAAIVAVAAIVGIVLVLRVSGASATLSERASTLNNIWSDESETGISDRLHRWKSASRMAYERPVSGWGLGAYPALQGRWTHRGLDAAEVITQGFGHANIAHNYYAQWAADTGTIGLTLHVAFIAAFLFGAIRALPRLAAAAPLSRAALLGCVAAAVAGSVDALGSPSYNYPGLFALYFALLGTGIAALRDALPRPATAERIGGRRNLPGQLPVPLLAGLAAALLVPGAGYLQAKAGDAAPRGVLVVKANPSGQVAPGTIVTWTATFTDERGNEQATMPGTEWTILADEFALGTAQTELERFRSPSEGIAHDISALSIRVPASRKPITAEASYRDGYGRQYRAEDTITVTAGTTAGATPAAPAAPAALGAVKSPRKNSENE